MFNFFPLIKRLSPKGLAYALFKNKQHTGLLKALGQEPDRICQFFELVQQSGIPDGNLPAEALSDWETFLGLSRNDSLTDQERNDRIKAKYASQGGQGPDYIETTLQDAGYPVFVVENFNDNPSAVLVYVATSGNFTSGSLTSGAFVNRFDPHDFNGLLIHGAPTYSIFRRWDGTLGGITLGETTLGDFISDSIIEDPVSIPETPGRYIYVWYLTGPGGLDDFVDIPVAQREDFIKQVLLIKPAHTWCVAQVNFV